jgi:hypothetical protein
VEGGNVEVYIQRNNFPLSVRLGVQIIDSNDMQIIFLNFKEVEKGFSFKIIFLLNEKRSLSKISIGAERLRIYDKLLFVIGKELIQFL